MLRDDLLKNIRILVVEDDSDTREMILYILQGSGAAVIGVESAEDAMQLHEKYSPDVVVTDIGIPGLDGYGLMAQIRADGERSGKRTPVIALTAYTSSVDHERAMAAGFEEYMGKPFNPADLIDAVLKALHQSPGGRSAA